MKRARSLPRAVAALAVVGVLALSACTSGGTTNSHDYTFTSYTKLGGLIPVADRKKAQDIGGSLLSGGTAKLSDYAGKVRLVNFFASWCGPCRIETPQLALLSKKDADVQFVGVDVDDQKSAVAPFLKQSGVRYPVIFDQSVRLPLELGNIPAKPPFTVLIDKAGRVAAVYYGALTVKDVQPALRSLTVQRA